MLETSLTNTHHCFDLPSNNSSESLCEIVYTYLCFMEKGNNILVFEESPLVTFANVGLSESKRKKGKKI